MVPADSDRVARAPSYSGYLTDIAHYSYGTITLYCVSFQTTSDSKQYHYWGPTTPVTPRRRRFGLFPFRSPLLRESLWFLFLTLLRCFSSGGWLPFKDTRLATSGLSHSDTRESIGYVHLIPAFRSLSRPSSPPGATGIPRVLFFAFLKLLLILNSISLSRIIPVCQWTLS